jgi:mannose-6-phosphate isomerase-like protein (cupin superfamily)
MPQFEQLNIHSYKNPNTSSPQHVHLFECEELKAELVILPPGASGDWHVHENAHELFDVIEGQGTFLAGDREFNGGPGKCVLIPAGVRHTLRNDGNTPWVLRITYQERFYPRHIGKLLGRAIRKRLGLH